MKICLIIHSLGIGGMERVVSILSNHFSSYQNTTVDILLIGRKRDVQYQLSKEVTIHRPDFNFDDSIRSWHTLKTFKFIRQTVKKLKPDTILSFGEIWNNLVLLSLVNTSFPLYVSDRCRPDKSIGFVHDFLRKWLYKRAEGIVAQTGAAKRFFSELTEHKNIEVIGNPIRSVPADKTSQKENEVLTVGRLIETKHHDRLIRLFSEVKKEGWVLRIVGGDAQKQKNFKKLKKLIKELKAEEYIFLEGEQANVDEYYHKAKIFAFTSSSEGFPNVIGEALSAGLPVVSYDCVAGPSDMIEDGKNGFLIELLDDESFKEKLSLLMSNGALQTEMGLAAKQSVEKYASEKISKHHYKFITSHT